MDDAISLLSLSTAGSSVANLERHPERRVKAAFAAFKEAQMPLLKKENPTLRLSQLNERLYELWKKSPENPFNQVAIAYDTKASDADALKESIDQSALDRLRI